MSTSPPEPGTASTTPIFDATIAAPAYEELSPGQTATPDSFFESPHTEELPAADDAGDSGAKQKAQEAADQAEHLSGSAKDAAADVASTAKDEAGNVASSAFDQAKALYGQATEELSSQAGKQQERVRDGLRSIGDDFTSMGDYHDSGIAAELAHTVGRRASAAGEWLEGKSPEDVLAEVQQFAARRPVLFIGLAAGAGIVASRLTKALVADKKAQATDAAADAVQ